MTKCSSLSKTKKNGWRCRITRHATRCRITPACELERRQQRFLFSNDYRVPQNILLSIAKHVILLSKTIFLTVGNAVLQVFFKNLESGSPGYVPAHSVSSLTWTLISFFVCWIIIVCYVAFVFFSFFLFLATCPLESFYAFLETRRFQWAHWQILASSCDFHSLHRRIRRACAHAVSKGPPPTI